MTYLTVPELAKKLHVNRDKVYCWINRQSNPLPAYNEGIRGIRIIEEEFVEWYKQYRINRRVDKLVDMKSA